MNVLQPILFQVYTSINGKRECFHLKADSGKLVFTAPERVPKNILELEEEIAYEIKLNYLL